MIEMWRPFVRQSNMIEGIVREPSQRELKVHHALVFDSGDGLVRERVRVEDLEEFVRVVAHASLRVNEGEDVHIAQGGRVIYTPPPGGPSIRADLADLLEEAASGESSPYTVHQKYEALHPFTDGNGRSGRALWAWMWFRAGRDPLKLGFLHSWYYESLSGWRESH